MASYREVTDFSKFRTTGELSDIVVVINDKEFNLHKFPLYIRSDFFRTLARSSSGPKDKVVLDDFPGGATTFEDVVNFFYGVKLKVTIENVCKLRCAAEFLQMNNRGNLSDITDRYLQDALTEARLNRDVARILGLLLQCHEIGPIAEQANIVDHCIMALIDCWLFSPSVPIRHFKSSQSGSCSSSKMVEDLVCSLPLQWFLSLFQTARDKAVKPNILTNMLEVYVNDKIGLKPDEPHEESPAPAAESPEPAADDSVVTGIQDGKDVRVNGLTIEEEKEEDPKQGDNDDNQTDDVLAVQPPKAELSDDTVCAAEASVGLSIPPTVNTASESEQLTYCERSEDPPQELKAGQVLDTLIPELPDNILIYEAISPIWALNVLQYGLANNCVCTPKLRKIVSRVIHHLSPTELVKQPADLVADLLRQSCHDEDDPTNSDQQEEMACTLIDSYLSELAQNDQLTVEIFNQMVEAVPKEHRFSHDTLFQVLDSLLKSERIKLNEGQRQAMLECINYERLSETSLQRAYELKLVPQESVTKAAFELCKKLRAELEDAQFVIKQQGKELKKHVQNIAPPKYTAVSYGNVGIKASSTTSYISSSVYPHFRPTYTARGVPTLASDVELDMVLESLERTVESPYRTYLGPYQSGVSTFSHTLPIDDYGLESVDNYRPQRSSYRFGRHYLY